MSRPLRIEHPEAWYHVMNHGRRSENVFLKKRDYHTFIELLKEASELWAVAIAAFCLMSNHYHLLIRTPQGNLSRFMRHVNGVYTQRFNKNNNYEGQLFKGRFKSILVDGDSYLLQLLRYIHRNPIRAKLVKNLDDFEWSSHQGYMSKSKDWEWLHKEFMLSIFSNNDKNQLIVYNEYMGQEDKKEALKILDGKKWPSFFGSDEFILTMKEKYYVDKRDKEVPESYNLSPDVDWIKEVVCKYYDIDPASLCISKRRVYNEPRNVAIYLSRYFTNSTLEQLGEDFNLNSHSAASNIITGIRKLKKNNLEFNEKFKEIENLCSKCQVKT